MVAFDVCMYNVYCIFRAGEPHNFFLWLRLFFQTAPALDFYFIQAAQATQNFLKAAPAPTSAHLPSYYTYSKVINVQGADFKNNQTTKQPNN